MCYSISSVLYCLFFGSESCGIIAPWPGIEPTAPELEGEVLTARPPGKSRIFVIFFSIKIIFAF